MKMKILALIPKIWIPAKSSITINEKKYSHTLMLFECESCLTLITEKQTIQINNQIALGVKKLKIVNSSNEISYLKGISFSFSDSAMAEIVLLADELERHARKIMSLFAFDKCNIDIIEHELVELLFLINLENRKLASISKSLRNQKIDSRLIFITRYIRDHYNEPITLNTLSDLIGCNTVYLSNTFSRVFNKSPVQYIQNIRMNHAKELLINTNLSIWEISKKIGYISSSQFASLFKRYFNLTPYEFRNINRSSNLIEHS